MQSLPELCLNRPVATATAVVAALVMGGVAAQRLPVEYLPEIRGRSLTVQASYPGSSAREIEAVVVEPLEEELASLEGLESLSATAQSSGATMNVELQSGADVDAAALEIRERIDRARALLPADMGRIEVRRWNSADRPVLRCRVAPRPDTSPRALEKFVDDVLVPRLGRVDGVGNVEVNGLARRRVVVELDAERLASAGLTSNDVARTLRLRNRNAAAGLLRHAKKALSVRVLGEIGDPATLAALPIGDDRVLADVARVIEETPELGQATRLDGRSTITIRVSKSSGSNTVATCDAVKAELDKILETPLAQGFRVEVFRDDSQRIRARLQNLQESAIYGGVLLCVVLLIFLRRFASTLIVATTIPLSVVLTFGMMYVGRRFELPLTLNVVSMMGLILGIGLVVDNGIVVLENIVRLREEGHDAKTAAALGARDVSQAVFASMVTSLIVFVPLFLTDSRGSNWVRPLGYVVCASVFASLWVSLSVVPLLSARLLGKSPARPGGGEGPVEPPRPGPLVRGYEWLLRGTLRFRLVLILILPLCGWQVYDFFANAKRSWGRGDSEREVELSVKVPSSFTPEERRELFSGLEALVLEHKADLDLARLTTRYSTGVDSLPQRRRRWGNRGDELELLLNDAGAPGKRLSVEEVRTRLRKLLPEVGGVVFNLGASRRMDGGSQSVSVLVTGRDAEALLEPAQQVARHLARLPGVEEVTLEDELGAPGLEIRPRDVQAARFGLAASQLGQAVSATLGERTVTRLRNPRREIEVVMRLEDEDRSSREALDRARVGRLQILDTEGQPVPGQGISLGSMAVVKTAPEPKRIRRQDRTTVARVTVNVAEGLEVREISQQIEEALAEVSLPRGIGVEQGREQRQWWRGERQNMSSFLLAFALVLIVLCALFESYVQPLVIATTVPFALVGVAWGFKLTDTSIDTMAWVGLMILCGLVVNHGIVFVDRVNRLLAEGLESRLALIRAGRDRLRPILMTTATTVLGLLPVLLQCLFREVFNADSGANVYGPIGLAVVCGLTVSTLLTLLVLPAILSVVLDLQAWFANKLAFLSEEGAVSELAPAEVPGEAPSREAGDA